MNTLRPVGDYVDLSYLNKKRIEVAPRAAKKSYKQAVGTAYLFETIGKEIKAWRRIEVAMA